MFENKQDTGLLRHSLLSVAKPHGGSLFNQDDTESSLATVSKSVKAILCHILEDVKDEREIVEIQHNVCQRLHAAVFFTTLSSHGITSDVANTFYGSISFGWPKMDLKFYVELNFKNQWSEYFIRCASQLPAEVLASLLKNILDISFSSQVKYYAWHLILQTIILKLLKITVDSEAECTFGFDFTSTIAPCANQQSDNTLNEQNDALLCVSNLNQDTDLSFEYLFNILFDSLCVDMQHSCDIDIIKILLNAVKTILKYKESLCDKNLTKICKLFGDCLSLNTNLKILKAALKSCAHKSVSCAYATTAWDIPENYLLLLINCYYSALSPEEVLNLKNKLECTEATKFFPLILQDLSPFSKEDFYVHNEKHLELLYSIIQHKFEAASFAAKILISNPVLLQKERTLKMFEGNIDVIDVINVYPLLLKNVLKVDSEFKVRLLKLFYRALTENSIKIYNDVLKYILSSHGFTEQFKLPDFEDHLALFVRKGISMEKLENVLPSLILQSPRVTLTCIIDEVISQGLDGEPLIQALKFIPEVCTYQKTFGDTTALIEILKVYLEKDELNLHVRKNLAILFKLLMEVHVETPIMSVDHFIVECIIPYLKPSNETELILQVLNIVVTRLVDKEATLSQKYLSSSESFVSLLNREFDISSHTLKCLISVLAQLLSAFIETGRGRLKELVTSSLRTIEDYHVHSGILNDEDKEELQNYFVSLNEMVQIYVNEFLTSSLEFKNLSSFWIWVCQTKNLAAFEEKFTKETYTYIDLINVLVQHVPHFTAEEWKFSVALVDILCKKSLLRGNINHCDMPFQLSEYEKKLYAVISCFITSLHFTLHDKIRDPFHTYMCFSNNLKTILKDEDLSPQMLLTVFLEICYLINCISPSLMSTFSSALYELRDRLLLCNAENFVLQYRKLILQALKCLSDSSEKTTLTLKMEISV